MADPDLPAPQPASPASPAPPAAPTVPEGAEGGVADGAGLLDTLAVWPSDPQTGTWAATAPTSAWEGRIFGGTTIAWVLAAAARTTDRPVHSLHGCFTAPVRPGLPVALRVDAVRDGRAFATRSVTATQDGRVAFCGLVSAHTPEPDVEPWAELPAGGSLPDRAAGRPAPWDLPFEAVECPPAPGLDGRWAATRRLWLRWPEALPDEPALHLALVGYLSDMTGSSFRPRSLGTWGAHTDASLDHALWLHRPVRVDRWHCYELQAVRAAGGRSLIRGGLWTEDGELVASMAQELLIRRL